MQEARSAEEAVGVQFSSGEDSGKGGFWKQGTAGPDDGVGDGKSGVGDSDVEALAKLNYLPERGSNL